MLGDVYTIIGKSGLYKLISAGNSVFIMEELFTGKKCSIPFTAKCIKVDDVFIYTQGEDVPLLMVFEKIFAAEKGQMVDIPQKGDGQAFYAYMEKVFPEFDKNRVYPNNIRKMLQWYNMLVKNNLTDFSIPEPQEEEEENPSSENEEPEKASE